MKINIPKLTKDDCDLIIKTVAQCIGLWLVVIIATGIFVKVV